MSRKNGYLLIKIIKKTIFIKGSAVLKFQVSKSRVGQKYKYNFLIIK
jgi:hypothetical protein